MEYGAEIVNLTFKITSMILLFVASAEDVREKKVSIYYLMAGISISAMYVVYGIIWESADVLYFIAGFLPGVVMILLSIVASGGIGIGDGLMIFALGPLLGAQKMCIAVMLAFMLSAFVCCVLLILRKITVKGRLAFLPFLTAGVGVMCFA